MSEWTITDMTATTPAATPEPVRLTAKQDLFRVLTEWADRNWLPIDDPIVMETDADGDLVVNLCGVTLEDGDIVPNERDYEYEATITLEVVIRGSVTARNEDDAREQAEGAIGGIDWDINAYSVAVVDWTETDGEVTEVSEE